MLINGIEIDLVNLEKPLLLGSEDEELLFLRLIQPTLENELIQCQLALSTRKSISLVRDFWLAMYKDREKLYINSGHALLYPIRLIIFEQVTQAEYFKRLSKKSFGDERLSLIYAVVLLQFVLQWIKERFSDNKEVYEALKLLYRTTDDNVDDDQTSPSREQSIGQAVAVKAIRFEVRENSQEFASLLYQTYNFINYLHDKENEKEEKETNKLPSLRNVEDTLNLFYNKRYTTNKVTFTG
ncbi:hypothetical protein FJQ98_20010 [Lysinibacillus agricola]|uniref:Uncharacterized protein n=1 Tax=Lysinibacillus agricola TaxID=2590012 RepID=A0ABX7APL2_9BACI|nr:MULTISPECIES: hypothetical protein [Lysinibacillus]KOS60979.1 hypothetical protein AN161_20640 [Lysinibacillus sp. FJAT-14222]QQP11467.1 hypothetical protein FJQ98_20010 [Lysinibacillus agricola]